MNKILNNKLIQPIINIIGSYNLLTIKAVEYLQIYQNMQLLIKTNMLKYMGTTTYHFYKNPKIRYNKKWNDWDIVDGNKMGRLENQNFNNYLIIIIKNVYNIIIKITFTNDRYNWILQFVN